jgi:hypothetical protein
MAGSGPESTQIKNYESDVLVGCSVTDPKAFSSDSDSDPQFFFKNHIRILRLKFSKECLFFLMFRYRILEPGTGTTEK